MSDFEVFLQQLIVGMSNGMIIALIALGYTMVYGILELINFAHGDVFMLGSFAALTVVGAVASAGGLPPAFLVPLLLVVAALFCGFLNCAIDRFAYRPLRSAHRLAPLVSAIGVSFILLNVGLLWGGLPLDVMNGGVAAAAPKDFPLIIEGSNLLGDGFLQFTTKDLLVWLLVFPMLVLLAATVKYTRFGRAMRAVAQDPMAARLMGINVDSVTSRTFFLGGALAGVASVIYALYNNTIFFQMGFRVGVDAFTAAVLGGIGNLFGALLGALVIGLVRALSDMYLATQWTNAVVFSILILILVFRPQGLMGLRVKEKV